MRLGPPLIDGIKPELAAWLTNLYAAFGQGLGFPARFQMGENFQLGGTVEPGAIFVTAGKGDPSTFTDNPAVDAYQAGISASPVGSTYHRTDGGAGTSFYVKEAAGAAGWAAK